MDEKYANLLDELAALKVEKEKMAATIADIKKGRDELKETNKTLVEKVETLESQNKDLTGKVSTIEAKEQEAVISKLISEDFKGKEKFAKHIIELADLGEGVDYTSLTDEQKQKVSKVLEDNPEFVKDTGELGGKVLPTQEILGKKEDDQPDVSNFSNNN